VRDDLADLLARDAVPERPLDVALELVAAIHCREGGHGDEAAVALGQLRPLPHVAEEHALRELDELGDDGAYFLASGRRGRWRHGVPRAGGVAAWRSCWGEGDGRRDTNAGILSRDSTGRQRCEVSRRRAERRWKCPG